MAQTQTFKHTQLTHLILAWNLTSYTHSEAEGEWNAGASSFLLQAAGAWEIQEAEMFVLLMMSGKILRQRH